MPRRIQPPTPRAHLRGTLKLLRHLAARSGGHPLTDAVWAFLDRPADLPEKVPREDAGLKYDAYIATTPRGRAWGVAVSDRYEGPAMLPHVSTLVDRLGGNYQLDVALDLNRQLTKRADVVVAVGFDAPDRPPRLKLYLQEDPWNTGLGTVRERLDWIRSVVPSTRMPDWCLDRQIGVAAVTLMPDGQRQLKLYFGGPTPLEAAAGAPPHAAALAQAMDHASPMSGGWYYLTLRTSSGQPHRYAINKIYNPIQQGFAVGESRSLAAWSDVERLFDHAGTRPTLSALYASLRGQNIVALPTATALEGSGPGDETDVYLAAWDLQPRKRADP